MVYSNCQCSSTFCLSVIFCPFYLGQPALKELSSWRSAHAVLVLCRLNCMCPFPILVSRAGCGIRLYRFLIVAFSSTDKNVRAMQ